MYQRSFRSLSLLAFLCLLAPSQALYFYLDGTTPKCFYEELPKDTLVVGRLEMTPLQERLLKDVF